MYKEINSDFFNTIEEGVFFENENYQLLFDNILSDIQEANIDFPQIKNTKILLSHGAIPNAYAIGNDIIVIYLALIKNITNQYELSFIICHEIAHNLLQHSYKDIINSASLKKSSDVRKNAQKIKWKRYNKGQMASKMYKDIIYHRRSYNRKLEREADSLGFILFKNAFQEHEYHAISVLKTLDSIDIPREKLSLSDYKKLLDTEKLSFKEEWINNEEISNYNYDRTQKFWLVDSLKTHDDCDVRAAFIEENFEIKETNIDFFSQDYNIIQQASHKDYVLGLYTIEEYGKSLYEALLLLKDKPNDSMLNKLVHLNFKKLYQAQKKYELNKYMELPNPRYADSYNEFLYSFRKIRNYQLQALIEKYKTDQI